MASTTPRSGQPNILVRAAQLIFDTRFLGVIAQIAAVVLVVMFFSWVIRNTTANLDKLGAAQFLCRDGTSSFRCAFDFLQSDAQFDISESSIDYAPSDSYWRALAVGAVNSIIVIAWGIVLTTILGTLVGIAQLSPNWLIRSIARAYVDIFRNTPLVLQLVFIFFVFFAFFLPNVDETSGILGLPIYLTKRGVFYPSIVTLSSAAIFIAFVLLGLLQAQLLWNFLARREEQTGQGSNRSLWALLAFAVVVAVGWSVASSRPSTHGIMVPNGLRVNDFDGLETVIRNRFSVNGIEDLQARLDAWEEVRATIEAGDLIVDGAPVTLAMVDDGSVTLDQVARRLNTGPLITPTRVAEGALKICAIRDTKAFLNFTAQLDRAGFPYTVNFNNRASDATAAYADGECEVYIADLTRLAAERDLLENGGAHTIVEIDEPPLFLSIPRLQGFNFVGGARLTSAFAAVLIGLVLNTGANVAEIVRAGIQSVSKGQTEAARALGLSENQRLRLVVLPQALQVIIPPQTSQYLNLAKNSTLALAVAFPDFWNVANTTINQSGRSIQLMLIVMGSYLALSLIISAFLNWYNARIKIRER